MAVAFPQIPDFAGLAALEATGTRSPRDLHEFAGVTHDHQTFPTASGDRISETELQEIRSSVLVVARKHGFPEKGLSKTAGFDRDCAAVLHSELPITVHTAASRGAWTFLTSVLLVDVAVWRFPKRNPQRFIGDPNRNAFRRLWMRREILGPPLGQDDPLWNREDVLVQVMERPGVAENRQLVRSISEVYRETWGDRSGPDREHLMRNFMLRIMRRQGLTRLECVSEERRRKILEEVASETSTVFGSAEKDPALTPRETVEPEAEVAHSDSPVPRRSERLSPDQPGAGEKRPEAAEEIEDIPLSELVKVVFDAHIGIRVGYLPRELDTRLLESGVRPEKRHRKTVDLIFKEFKDEDQLVKMESESGDQVWTSGQTASGTLDPQVRESIADIRWLASTLGLREREDRPTLAEKIGVETPMPKYLKRLLNSAISAASKQ